MQICYTLLFLCCNVIYMHMHAIVRIVCNAVWQSHNLISSFIRNHFPHIIRFFRDSQLYTWQTQTSDVSNKCHSRISYVSPFFTMRASHLLPLPKSPRLYIYILCYTKNIVFAYIEAMHLASAANKKTTHRQTKHMNIGPGKRTWRFLLECNSAEIL